MQQAAKRLKVSPARLRRALLNRPGNMPLQFNTFNTITQEECDELKHVMGSALMQNEVLALLGITESVLHQFIGAGALLKRERPEWDLNVHKPFDKADVDFLQNRLIGYIQPAESDSVITIAMNDVNNRLSTNKAVIAEVFEQIVQGTLKAVNVQMPSCIGELEFDRDQVVQILGNAQDVAMLSAEQLSRLTDWRSECIGTG